MLFDNGNTQTATPPQPTGSPYTVEIEDSSATPNAPTATTTKHSWAELHKLLDNIASLVDVKTIVTFAVVGCLCYLATIQNVTIPSELFAAVISSIMTYFFTKKVDEKTTKKE